jgi:hypothetical protein
MAFLFSLYFHRLFGCNYFESLVWSFNAPICMNNIFNVFEGILGYTFFLGQVIGIFKITLFTGQDSYLYLAAKTIALDRSAPNKLAAKVNLGSCKPSDVYCSKTFNPNLGK